MKSRFHSSLIIIAGLITCLVPMTGAAQVKTAATSKVQQTPHDPLMSLPDSDGVVSIDVQRLLNEMLPRVLADDPTRLAQVNSRIDQIKTRTGIDVRMFDRVAVGVNFVKGATLDSLKVESVAFARGRFNAPGVLSAGLIAANSKYKYQQQKYGGKTIYIFSGDELFGKEELPQIAVSDEARKAGGKATEIADNLLQKIMSFKGEIGIVALDANTLAIGQPSRIRAAIDANAGKGRVAIELTQLATRNPNAVVSFGVNAPSNASRAIGLDNDLLATSLDSIRQVYGSINSTSTGFELQTFARTGTNAQAQEVYDMLVGFKELGGFIVSSRMSGDMGKLAQTAIDNLKIVKEANEVQIRLELAQADVASLVRVFDKRN